jgi:putative peptidoglycan lipid II flippase
VLVAAYVLVVLAVDPRGLALWIAFAGVLFAGPVGGVYAAFVTAQRRYTLATLRIPLMTAVALVTAVVLLAVWDSIAALAVAISVGQLVSLGLLVTRERWLPAPAGDESDRRGLGFRVLGPAGSVFVATLVGAQLIVLVERFLASTVADGAVTLLVNARGFVLVPAIAAQALGSGVFPAATERYRALGREGLANLALVAVRLASVIAAVSAAYIAICGQELIEVALQRGKFDQGDTVRTARLIAIMAPSLLGISAAAVAGKALFGLGRQRLVAAVTGTGVVLYIGAAVGLRGHWAVEGLAAAFLISSLVTGLALALALALVLDLRARAAFRDWLVAPAAFGAVFTAAAGAVWLAMGRGEEGVLTALATLAAAGVAGLAALAVAIVAVRGSEYELLRRGLRGAPIGRALVERWLPAPGR